MKGKFYIKTKLSENMSLTPEGYLLCKNVPLTHTGKLKYVSGEHPFSEEGIDELIVTRSKAEIHSEKMMASFLVKPVTIEHPEDMVSPENWQQLAHGSIVNVRPSPEKIEVDGEMEDATIGDLMIMTAEAIRQIIEEGLREVSLGYECVWEIVKNNLAVHKNIVGNHVALVSTGRAGENFSIKDSGERMKITELQAAFKKKFGIGLDDALKTKTPLKPVAPVKKPAKDSPERLAAIDAEMEKLTKEKADLENPPAPAASDEGGGETSGMEAKIDKLIELVTKLVAPAGDADEEEVVEDSDEDEVLEVEDEDGDEEGEMEAAGDSVDEVDDETAATAEILAPGIALTKTVKKDALEACYKTTDGKKVIDKLLGGQKLSSVKDHSILFNSAAEVLKVRRTTTLKRVSAVSSTKDTFLDTVPKDGVMTAEKLNELNAKAYATK